jgi:predicted homoserine dehydrogenase-like protein
MLQLLSLDLIAERDQSSIFDRKGPAQRGLELDALPIGLAHNVRMKRAVRKDTIVSFNDVEMTYDLDVVSLRREMENQFRPGKIAAA